MTSRRQPLVILGGIWLLLVLALGAGVCWMRPPPSPVIEAPAATVTRVPMTVLPTLTPTAQLAAPALTRTPTPEPAEVLPRATSTRVPPTDTPTPTAEPTIVPTPDKPPVQRG